ncbi:uncharacterized protein [Euwallacea similis]|uniref:uncharacterized protein isoform X1 n=1 Tax=Euwallacea similis TaxID=1736056 RepID=UPI00344E6774
MHKKVTISDLNIDIQGRGKSIKEHLVAKLGLGVIEFLLASVLYCYGIILSEYILSGTHTYEEGIWTSILFVCCWSLSEPYARLISEYFEDKKHRIFRNIVGIGSAFLFITTMIPNNVTIYTVFGGILSCIISTQLRHLATDRLDMDAKIYEAIRQVSRALSLFIMPQFIFWLLSYYKINEAKLIVASLLFHIVPAALLIKSEDYFVTPVGNSEMSRYQTIGRYSYQMKELKRVVSLEESSLNGSVEPDHSSSSSDEDERIFEITPIRHLNSSSLESSTSENSSQFSTSSQYDGMINYGASEHSVGHLVMPTMHLNPLSIQAYFYKVGVSILPGIPEENEDEETNINYIDPKRLSMISDKLEELNIQDQIRRESIREVFNINEVINEHKPEPINHIEYIPNFKDEDTRISVMHELKNLHKGRNCFHCAPYRKYVWTRRLRIMKDCLIDNVFRPLYHAAKNLYFYPALTTKVVTSTVSTLYITLAPFMAMQNTWKQTAVFNTENVTFLLTYVAFAWCFFLVTLPLVIKLNPNKIRIIFGCGLIISGTSLWILSARLSNDVITLSSLLFGFGHGIVWYMELSVYKSSIGMRPWCLVRGALEVLSVIIILLIYYLISRYKLDLNSLLFFAALVYYANAGLWFCLPFFKFFISIVKRMMFDKRNQQEGFFP